jgi:hypothetical protein
VAAKYILAAASVIFLVLALTRVARSHDARHPQTRTWLTVAAIFAAVSAWLFVRG